PMDERIDMIKIEHGACLPGSLDCVVRGFTSSSAPDARSAQRHSRTRRPRPSNARTIATCKQVLKWREKGARFMFMMNFLRAARAFVKSRDGETK
ncbi:MAG TPA: hypothetical protein VN284_10920, partial [Rhizobium sp.]|nr:hypothetical protein [Rhizobium sp.]